MPPAGDVIGPLPARNSRGCQVKGRCEGDGAAATLDNFGRVHHGNAPYGKRNACASDITRSVIDRYAGEAHLSAVLTKSELLRRVDEAAASRAEIARVLSLAPARITEMFKGGRDLSFDEARTLMRHYGIDTEGTSSISEVASEHGIAMVEEVDLALGMGGGMYADLAQTKGLVPFKQEWLRGLHSGSTASLRVVRGEGDSMQPTILDGDLVLIDTAQDNILSQDRIWAVFWGELGMIKRVRRQPSGSFMLMSDNASIAPIEAVDGEMHVLGRVIWIGRRM